MCAAAPERTSKRSPWLTVVTNSRRPADVRLLGGDHLEGRQSLGEREVRGLQTRQISLYDVESRPIGRGFYYLENHQIILRDPVR